MGLKPPPRELVMAAGRCAGYRSCETLGLIEIGDEAETRMFPTQRGVVAVTVAGRMTGLGSIMVKVKTVMLEVLLDWDVGAWDMNSRGMT